MMPKMKETKRFNENPACHSDFCGSDTQVCSLSDDLLKRALLNANMIRFAEVLKEETTHIYSPRYRKGMGRLLNRKDAVKYAKRRMRSAGVRLLQHAVCILLMVVLIVGSALTFRPDIRAEVRRFAEEFHENCVRLFFLKNASSDDPVALQDVMKESEVKELWVPKGYEIEIINTGKRKNSFKKVGYAIWENGNDSVCLYWMLMKPGDVWGIHQSDYTAKKRKIGRDSVTATLCISESEGNNDIYWNSPDQNVFFIISGKLDEESLIKMAEDVMRKRK